MKVCCNQPCNELLALDAVYCPECGQRAIEQPLRREPIEPEPTRRESMMPGRLRMRREAGHVLAVLDRKRRERR